MKKPPKSKKESFGVQEQVESIKKENMINIQSFGEQMKNENAELLENYDKKFLEDE